MSAAGTTWRAPGVAHQGELTPLQRRIMALLEMGRTRPQIAAAVGLHVDAVKQHIKKIRDWRAFEAMRRAVADD